MDLLLQLSFFANVAWIVTLGSVRNVRDIRGALVAVKFWLSAASGLLWLHRRVDSFDGYLPPMAAHGDFDVGFGVNHWLGRGVGMESHDAVGRVQLQVSLGGNDGILCVPTNVQGSVNKFPS